MRDFKELAVCFGALYGLYRPIQSELQLLLQKLRDYPYGCNK